MCCPCEALVEDDAEELHRLLDLDRDVIDLEDDILVKFLNALILNLYRLYKVLKIGLNLFGSLV